MPGFDRTGPLGQGPMTGRGLGYCNPTTRRYLPGQPLYGLGRGGIPWGGGRGRGFGGGRGRFGAQGAPYVNAGYPEYYAYPPPVYSNITEKDEREYLENTLSGLKEDINRIQTRLDELATSDDSK